MAGLDEASSRSRFTCSGSVTFPSGTRSVAVVPRIKISPATATTITCLRAPREPLPNTCTNGATSHTTGYAVPTFVVDGGHGPRLFFGQDRLHFVKEVLAQHPMAAAKEGEHTVAAPTLLTPTTVANEGRRVIFYYDLASPFAYLGATQIERVAKRCGAVVDYRPILLGGLFRSLGTPMVPLHTYPEAKQRHTHEDLHRWARYYDEPFRFPHRFPMSTVTAQRLLICAKSHERIGALTLALFRAYWADDQDLADPAVLEAALRAVGLPESLLEEAVSPAIKEQLHKYTDEAQALGVFGVPTFVVEKKAGPPALIFGQDRLLFVEKALLGTLGDDGAA
mgnify:CR=1 FL=1